MSDSRPRPPRQRQPSFFLEDYNYNQAVGGEEEHSPPGSSSGGHSSADLYRGVAPPGSGPILRSGAAKQLPPPPGGRSTAVAGPFGDEMGAISARSSFSEDTQLHLRNAPSAREPRIEGLPSNAAYGQAQSHPGYAASERDSFFAPPAMPWMRGEGSVGGPSAPSSRPESPSFFGGARTSSASPMPYYPQSSSFSHAPYSTASTYAPGRPKKAFVSNLLTGPIDKPWLKRKDRWAQASWWITVILWFAGAAGAAVLCFFAYRDVPSVGKVCLQFQDDFSSGSIDSSKWTREVSVSGFGNGGFEWTTDGDTNAYVKNGQLYIMPTLTEETGGYSRDQIFEGVTSTTIPGCTNDKPDSNLYYKNKPIGTAAGISKRDFTLLERAVQFVKRAPQAGKADDTADDDDGITTLPDGTTTNDGDTDTSGTGTSTGGGANGATGGGTGTSGSGAAANGQHDPCTIQSARSAQTVVNPVQSARLVTSGSSTGSLKYGRVEIRAKMPTGDWLFPQLLMLPKNTAYGSWPLSGEIDIVMGRGNDPNYKGGGRDFITSGLQWGPGVGFNAFDRTRGWYQQRRTNFNQAFTTFTLEWTDKFLWVFVDKRVQRVINLDFKKQSFFQRGHFPITFQNGSDEAVLQNPWRDAPNSAPFDQEFYLVMTVQAGGTNGWFQDNVGKKPWFDRSAAAMFDFANATDTWKATWPSSDKDRAMIIDSVKMWKTC